MSYRHVKSSVILNKNSSSHVHSPISRHLSPLPDKYSAQRYLNGSEEKLKRKQNEHTHYLKQSTSDQKGNPSPPYTSKFPNTPTDVLQRRHQVPPIDHHRSFTSHNFGAMSLGPGPSERSKGSGSEKFPNHSFVPTCTNSSALSNSFHKSFTSDLCHSSQIRPPEGASCLDPPTTHLPQLEMRSSGSPTPRQGPLSSLKSNTGTPSARSGSFGGKTGSYKPNSSGASSQSLLCKSGGKVGISNLGNTCFMNSMLQCLGQTGEMTDIFLKNTTYKEKEKPLVQAYSSLMQQMWKASQQEPLYPRALKDSFCRKNPQFSGYNQHDSQEFMRFLVSGLHEELKKKPRVNYEVPRDENDEKWWNWYMNLENSELAKIFVGQLCSTLTCSVCKGKSLTFDPYWELSVSLPKSSSSDHLYSYSHSSPHCQQPRVHLKDCLGVFTQEESLDGTDKPYCLHCKKQQCCWKKITIQRLPKVLVIHLKRFSGYGYRSKLDTQVTIPHLLNVSQFCSKGVKSHDYELYALSNHSGSVFFGHYTAWCKHYVTKEWHTYNDGSVSQTSSSDLTSKPEFTSTTAYVLFYRQVTKSKITYI